MEKDAARVRLEVLVKEIKDQGDAEQRELRFAELEKRPMPCLEVRRLSARRRTA